ncbi:MAG: lipoprotein-releasing ABC transporter permease subunit [Gammaproteobacteria bacterium]
MFRPVELFIGIRYIHARRGNHFIAFISLTAIIATALGVAVLLTILSIMNGFEGELRERILGMAAHVELDAGGADAAAIDDALARLAARPGVVGATPFIARDVLVQNAGRVRAVEARGIVAARELAVTTLGTHMTAGLPSALEAGAFRVLVGRELADYLGLSVGDRLSLVSPRPLVTPAGVFPRMKRFEVGGVFEFGLQEHDAGLVLVDRRDAARLFRTGAPADGIRVRLDDAAAAPAVRAALAALTDMSASDWTQTHSNLFRALEIEKMAMFVILALAVGIAAFNLVSILVVAVTEKRNDIAMLAALGLEARAIMRVFLWQGALTGAAGVTGGLVLGYLLSANAGDIVAAAENLLGFKVFSPEVYYISSVPSEPEWGDFALTAALAALLAALAPLYPAWLAARTAPAHGLRHE